MSQTDTTIVAPWGKWDRLSLQLILVGTSLYALIVLAGGTGSIIATLVSGSRDLSLTVDGSLPPGADTGSAALIDGRYETARVAVAGLSPFTSGLLTAGLIVGVLTQVIVAASFVYLAFRLLRRRPFLRSLTWSFVVAGAALLLGSMIEQACTGFGSWLVASELGSTPGTEDFWTMAVSFDLAPLGFGFALMLVGSAFEYAQKLARDSEGLV